MTIRPDSAEHVELWLSLEREVDKVVRLIEEFGEIVIDAEAVETFGYTPEAIGKPIKEVGFPAAHMGGIPALLTKLSEDTMALRGPTRDALSDHQVKLLHEKIDALSQLVSASYVASNL